jgi:hypothetical protein
MFVFVMFIPLKSIKSNISMIPFKAKIMEQCGFVGLYRYVKNYHSYFWELECFACLVFFLHVGICLLSFDDFMVVLQDFILQDSLAHLSQTCL